RLTVAKPFGRVLQAAVPVVTITTCGLILRTPIVLPWPTMVAFRSLLLEAAPGIASSCQSRRCITLQLITEFLTTSTATSRMIHLIAGLAVQVVVALPVRFLAVPGTQWLAERVVGPHPIRSIPT